MRESLRIFALLAVGAAAAMTCTLSLPGVVQAQSGGDDDDFVPEGESPLVEEDAPKRKRLLALVIAEDPKHDGRALVLSRATSKRLSSMQGMAVADFVASIDPAGALEMKSEIKLGLESLSAGLTAFEDLDLEAAGTDLDAGINYLLPYADLLSHVDRQRLDEGLFALATTTLFEGQGDLADAAFVALLMLSPGFEPEKDKHPSNVYERFRKVREDLNARPSGAMEVTSSPTGAAVFVDGAFVGSTPTEIAGLASGQHSVVVERRGYRPLGSLTFVAADKTAQLELELEPTKAADVAEGLSVSVTKYEIEAYELADKLSLDRLLVLRLWNSPSGDKVSGLWIDGKNKKVLERVPLTPIVDAPDVAATTIIAAIGAKAPPPKAAPPPPPPPKVVEVTPITPLEVPEIMEKWWFWAIVGGVIATAAVTTVVATADRGPGAPPRSGHILGF